MNDELRNRNRRPSKPPPPLHDLHLKLEPTTAATPPSPFLHHLWTTVMASRKTSRGAATDNMGVDYVVAFNWAAAGGKLSNISDLSPGITTIILTLLLSKKIRPKLPTTSPSSLKLFMTLECVLKSAMAPVESYSFLFAFVQHRS